MKTAEFNPLSDKLCAQRLICRHPYLWASGIFDAGWLCVGLGIVNMSILCLADQYSIDLLLRLEIALCVTVLIYSCRIYPRRLSRLQGDGLLLNDNHSAWLRMGAIVTFGVMTILSIQVGEAVFGLEIPFWSTPIKGPNPAFELLQILSVSIAIIEILNISNLAGLVWMIFLLVAAIALNWGLFLMLDGFVSQQGEGSGIANFRLILMALQIVCWILLAKFVQKGQRIRHAFPGIFSVPTFFSGIVLLFVIFRIIDLLGEVYDFWGIGIPSLVYVVPILLWHRVTRPIIIQHLQTPLPL
ncbi:hypothetical protein [Pontibacter sp. G13]|uniref:hypothetical protein n=1 Tax=Pontibacter sp. G13 TaxID=3074898 RepID=UPI00288C1DDE|nr:hypothetical protein [Pontibacter sp. G13]WNJ16313.1 hypothetical protein RJD25_15725 [Pontibacter sp. G13]